MTMYKGLPEFQEWLNLSRISRSFGCHLSEVEPENYIHESTPVIQYGFWLVTKIETKKRTRAIGATSVLRSESTISVSSILFKSG